MSAPLPRGSNKGLPVLLPEQVREIRKRHAAGGISYGELGRQYGVTHKSISAIVQRFSHKKIV